ncbi:MAG: hypothetical protein RLY71_3043 [Pseudomonadota bacterium]|jgi:DNA-binding NarL/FixJ family response regulator
MKILVIDDHPLWCAGVTSALRESLGQPIKVLPGSNGIEAISLCQDHPDLDLVLLDLNLHDEGGLAVLPRLHHLRPLVPVVILSGSESAHDMRHCLAAGARGYIPKSTDGPTMGAALRMVLAGGTYLPPQLSPQPTLAWPAMPLQAGAPQATRTATSALTERQQEVLDLMCCGCSNKEISRTLGLSEKTTKAHVSAIFRALNVVSRTQAVLAARQAA